MSKQLFYGSIYRKWKISFWTGNLKKTTYFILIQIIKCSSIVVWGIERSPLFLQPFLKQCRFLFAYHNILILTSFQSYYEFGTEVKTDFSDAINVGDILSIETEETGRV